MRVSPLDKAIPISYDAIATSLATPYFRPITDVFLNSSNHLKVHVNPYIDPLGSIGFPHYQDKQHTRSSFLTHAGSISYPVPASSSVAMGFPISNPPDFEEDYLYQVTGNVRSVLTNNYPSRFLQMSICLCHGNSVTDSGFDSEHYVATVISEYPFQVKTIIDSSFYTYLPEFSFNLSFTDLGAPRSDDSVLLLCLVFRNAETANNNVPPLFVNLNMWRMFAPLKVFNQWQS